MFIRIFYLTVFTSDSSFETIVLNFQDAFLKQGYDQAATDVVYSEGKFNHMKDTDLHDLEINFNGFPDFLLSYNYSKDYFSTIDT